MDCISEQYMTLASILFSGNKALFGFLLKWLKSRISG